MSANPPAKYPVCVIWGTSLDLVKPCGPYPQNGGDKNSYNSSHKG